MENPTGTAKKTDEVAKLVKRGSVKDLAAMYEKGGTKIMGGDS